MKCGKKVKKFVGWAAKFLGPSLGAYIPHMVTAAEAMGEYLAKAAPEVVFGGHEKRAFVIEQTFKRAEQIGHEAFASGRAEAKSELEGAIRAAIQPAVYNLQAGATEGLEELADWSDYDENDPDLED